LQHGEAAISVWRYATTSQFWFESMQNSQSEFIAVAAIVGPLMVDSDRGRVVACIFWRTAGWCRSQCRLVHARIVTKCVAASDHPSSIETCTTSAAWPQIGHHAES